MGRAKAVFDLRATYFLYYVALGTLFPFLNLYYARIGLTGLQMGSLAALSVLVGTAGSVGWSALADRFGWHRGLFSASVFGCVISVVFISRASDFTGLLLWTVLWSLVGSPLQPILDGLTIRRFEKEEGYGPIRVGGTFGWALATLGMGYLLGVLHIRWIFYGYMVGLVGAWGAFLVQPRSCPETRPQLARDLGTLLLDPKVLGFLASVALLGTALGGASQFLSLYLAELGAKEALIGGAWTLGAVSEIPVMFGAGRLIRRLGLTRMLQLSFLIFAGRWLLLALVPSAPWALALQLVHGVAFGLFLVGGVTYTNRLAPLGLGTTAQAIFSTVSFSLSSLGGALLGGYIYDTVGLRVLFLILSGITLGGGAVFGLASRPRGRAAARGGCEGHR